MPDPAQFRERLRGLATREAFRFPLEAVPAHYRRAAVLIPFWEEAGTVRVLLTRRAGRMSRHAGEVAFPGGLLEGGESWEEAALREADEEVGLAAEEVEVLGRLDDAWSGAENLLAPIVGWLERPPRPAANPHEVEQVLIASVAELLRPEARRQKTVSLGRFEFVDSILAWNGPSIVGLSADLLLEALAWAEGNDAAAGPRRLRDLRRYLAYRASEAP